VILLVSVVAAGLIACAAHGDQWVGAHSTAPGSHGFGCSVPLMIAGLLATLSLLSSTGGLVPQLGPERLLRLPVSFFQPPERSA